MELLQKIQPPLAGPTSWIKYEELVDDWQDITQLEAGRRWQDANADAIFHPRTLSRARKLC